MSIDFVICITDNRKHKLSIDIDMPHCLFQILNLQRDNTKLFMLQRMGQSILGIILQRCLHNRQNTKQGTGLFPEMPSRPCLIQVAQNERNFTGLKLKPGCPLLYRFRIRKKSFAARNCFALPVQL
ncbi:hypothetical protein D3C81_1920590 [compost metagenome]